ncbi:MAG: response regulator transcription factor [Anaerolineae bacterium]|jgi:NarL family two-component system response regulator LiaR|nr:response regulator transcription factor [Anaerolineae bacterium]
MEKKINVVLVDDHTVVRNGVRAYLEAQDDIEVVGECENGETAIEMVKETMPDVVLMDLVMEDGIDGVEATRRVKRISPRTQVVVLTSYHQDEYIFPALKAGAISYIIKDVKMEDLADAIRKASKNEAVLHSAVASRVIQELRGGNFEEINPFSELTSREMDVLKLIAQGLSNHEIADKLVISENTVKGHVSNVLSKLQLADRTQAAVFAWKKGIVK